MTSKRMECNMQRESADLKTKLERRHAINQVFKYKISLNIILFSISKQGKPPIQMDLEI